MPRLGLIGLVGGFFSALFGVGGGIVLVPLLLLVGRLDGRRATATSLAAILVTAAAGTVAYAALDRVHLVEAALVGIPAAAGAVGGAWLQQRVAAERIAPLFAVLLVAVAVWLLAA